MAISYYGHCRRRGTELLFLGFVPLDISIYHQWRGWQGLWQGQRHMPVIFLELLQQQNFYIYIHSTINYSGFG